MWTKITQVLSSSGSNKHLVKIRLLYNKRFQSGFSLIELMIATGIVSILATVAIPRYVNFTKNGDISNALTTLINLSTQMEKNYLDVRNYGDGSSCVVAAPNSAKFDFACSSSGQNYTWAATSKDSNYEYTINQNGIKSTEIFDGTSLSGKSCWVLNDVGSCY